LKYQWNKVTAFLNINNITDEEYAEYGALSSTGEPAFYPSPTINFLAGVTIDY
jgi:outer membrane receptor protein involved in Fe transport